MSCVASTSSSGTHAVVALCRRIRGNALNELGLFVPTAASASGLHTTARVESKKGRLKEPLARRADRGRRRAEHHDRATSMGGDASTSASASASAPPQANPELVERFMGLLSPKERKQAALQSVIRDFARFPGDSGSSEVQVALLTNKISSLAEHLKVHRKDYSSKRGLMAMLNQRRQTLQYLRRSDFGRYEFCLDKLGLKDLGKTYDRLSARYSD